MSFQPERKYDLSGETETDVGQLLVKYKFPQKVVEYMLNVFEDPDTPHKARLELVKEIMKHVPDKPAQQQNLIDMFEEQDVPVPAEAEA